MYNMNVKMKFIEMRAAGMPMYKIADEIGVHRVTLIRWNKELAAYILIAKQDIVDELLLENNCIKLKRTEVLSRHLAKMYEKLDMYAEQPEKSAEYGKTLDNISKLTRLLLMETSSRGPENVLLDKHDDEKASVGITSALLVTDNEKFDRYSEGDNSEYKPEIEKYENNLTLKTGEMLHTGEESIQNIFDKHPVLQEIFNRSIKRSSEKIKAEIIYNENEKASPRMDYAM